MAYASLSALLQVPSIPHYTPYRVLFGTQYSVRGGDALNASKSKQGKRKEPVVRLGYKIKRYNTNICDL